MELQNIEGKTSAEIQYMIVEAVVETIRENYDMLKYEKEYGSLQEKISGAMNRSLKLYSILSNAEYLLKAPREEVCKRYGEYMDIFISLVNYHQESLKLIERIKKCHS